MNREQALKAIYSELKNKLVVTIMGACAQELYNLGHQENFFYSQHAMGLASSIGLGLALNLPTQKVVVLDGDGSILMNLGSLTTLARYNPPNLTHIIFDNGSLLSMGGIPTHTATGVVDLAAIAKGAGIPQVNLVETLSDFKQVVTNAFEQNTLSVIVAKVKAVGPDKYGMDLKLPENAFRFERYIRHNIKTNHLNA